MDENFKTIEFIKSTHSDFPNFKSFNELRFLNMNTNMLRYAEAKKHNLYYHKKAYIKSNGTVYNAPFSEEIHGNIFKQSILSIIKTVSFQKHWNITKDLIKVCCDCQYRYACVDGRIPQKSKSAKTYYFNNECKYNPYENSFNEN